MPAMFVSDKLKVLGSLNLKKCKSLWKMFYHFFECDRNFVYTVFLFLQ